MRTFAVYESPKGECEAVKIGFSWPAFLFTGLWAFARGLWLRGLALIGIQIMLGLVAAATAGFIIGVFQMPESALDATFRLTQTVVIIPFMVIVGRRANDWRRKDLAKKGYTVLNETVIARSGEEAITTVKPELISEDRLLKRAHKMISEGKTDEAELVLQRLVREHKDDENVLKAAREELEQIRSKAA
jgi:hypothetical protein